MLPGFFFDTVGSGIRDMQKEAAAKAERDQQNELQILQILAQHGSDDVRGIAGTAWLDLAQNPNRPRAKGLAGFLGQTEKSPYFKDVQASLSAAKMAPQQPPSAAMSTNAPVSPGSSPIQPAPAGPTAPPVASPLQGPQMQPGMDSTGQHSMGMQAAPAGPEPLAPIPTQPMFAPPPPPPKIRSLFPTAQEIAQQKVDEATMLQNAKDEQTVAMLTQQGATPQQIREALLSTRGAHPARVRMESRIFTMRDGSIVMGSFDPSTGDRLGPGGDPIDAGQIMDERRAPTNQPKGPGWRLVRDDATGEWTWIQQPGAPAPGAPGASGVAPAPGPPPVVSSGISYPPPVPPPDFAGTSTIEGPGGTRTVVQNPRTTGGRSRVVGPAPTPGQADPQKIRFQVWKDEIDKAVKAISGKDEFGTMKVPTPQEIQAIVTNTTKQPGVTYDDVAMGAKGGPTPQRGARSGKTLDQADRLIQSLNAASSRFAGNASPVAPAPAPPPRR